MNPYHVLGISPNATENEIKNAYRKLRAKYHPDRSQKPQDYAMFVRIQDAYTMLSSSTSQHPQKTGPSTTRKSSLNVQFEVCLHPDQLLQGCTVRIPLELQQRFHLPPHRVHVPIDAGTLPNTVLSIFAPDGTWIDMIVKVHTAQELPYTLYQSGVYSHATLTWQHIVGWKKLAFHFPRGRVEFSGRQLWKLLAKMHVKKQQFQTRAAIKTSLVPDVLHDKTYLLISGSNRLKRWGAMLYKCSKFAKIAH